MCLTIRKMREEDLGPLCALLADPRVMRYPEPPFTVERTDAFLHAAGLSDTPLIYAAENDGAFLGYVICHDHDDTGIEIGWVLFPEHWGKGYASRLTRQLTEHCFALSKEPVIECVPGQEASKRIAAKFGFGYEGMRDGLEVYRLRPAHPGAKRPEGAGRERT